MSTRSENKRELERALNGMNGEYGVSTHLSRVFNTMEKAVSDIIEYNNQNPNNMQEIPELYKEIVGYLILSQERVGELIALIEKLLEVI